MSWPDPAYAALPPREAQLGTLGTVCRLGLATRGNTDLDAEAVQAAIAQGINYLNWCGYPDGMSEAVRKLSGRRRDVLIAVQLDARSAVAARHELEAMLGELGTDYLDVVTYYYVEHPDEWREIIAPGGAAEALAEARAAGRVRAVGLTSHQRALAAQIADSGRIDLLMIRYNAAHRGAERQIFPVTRRRGLPVVAYTALRWGALLRSTPDDPPGFVPPTAADCYRFALGHPAVAVVLMAPDNARELAEDLALLDDWRGLEPGAYGDLRSHGDRVRRHAGSFP